MPQIQFDMGDYRIMGMCSFGCGRETAPNSKLGPCQTCRAAMHRLYRLRGDEMIKYTGSLAIRQKRFDAIASVNIRGKEVKLATPEELMEAGIMMFPGISSKASKKAKRLAMTKATVTSIKTAIRKKELQREREKERVTA